jgi:hypothetical protein
VELVLKLRSALGVYESGQVLYLGAVVGGGVLVLDAGAEDGAVEGGEGLMFEGAF